MAYVVTPPSTVGVPVNGTGDLFPVRRIFCVGRNYAAHAREMGHDPDREPPFFFTKPADAIVICADAVAWAEIPPAGNVVAVDVVYTPRETPFLVRARNAGLAVNAAGKRTEIARIGLDQAREVLQSITRRYEAGAASNVDVIDAQTAYVAATGRNILVLHRFWEAWFCVGAFLFGLTTWRYWSTSGDVDHP